MHFHVKENTRLEEMRPSESRQPCVKECDRKCTHSPAANAEVILTSEHYEAKASAHLRETLDGASQTSCQTRIFPSAPHPEPMPDPDVPLPTPEPNPI